MMRPIDRRAGVTTGRRVVAEALTDRDVSPPLGRSERRDGVSEEDVRVRAYHLWEAAGRPDGDGVEFWVRAEQELMGSGTKAG